jgi:hypothetical protein
MSQEEPPMSPEEPAMPSEEPAIHATPTEDTVIRPPHAAVQTSDAVAYKSLDERQDWPEEPLEGELPPRPRKRLLTPIPLALIGILLIACGFIGGVLVEKGQSSSSSTGGAASLASRFAALRGTAGAAGTSARSGSGSAGGSSAAGGSAGAGFGGSSSAGGGFTRPTAGTVAYLDGSTLYVTNAEGNTVKVTTSAATSVNKTVKSTVKGIHPGETVTVTGETGVGGAVSAESINVGGGGGLASLFGGSGGRGGSDGSSRGGGGEPALFGG